MTCPQNMLDRTDYLLRVDVNRTSIRPLPAAQQEEFSLYSIPVIVAIGFVGNTLTFLVTMRKKNRHLPSSLYMASIAVADNMSLVSAHLLLNLVVYQLDFGAGTWFSSQVGASIIFLFTVIPCQLTHFFPGPSPILMKFDLVGGLPEKLTHTNFQLILIFFSGARAL
jgi:hypothetical protein